MTNPTSGTSQDAGFKAFLEHLFELRDRLLRIVIAIIAVFILLSPFVQDLYNWLSDPLMRYLPEGEKLIAIGVASPFLIPFKLACSLGVDPNDLVAIHNLCHRFLKGLESSKLESLSE